ncbi:MAG: glutaminyl-peptide cyclotransferase [Syntrophales bacterium]|nr:glutaminyl-peptide cyclotransferase [Syntrophales bacterium]
MVIGIRILVCAFFIIFSQLTYSAEGKTKRELLYRLIESYPHDPAAFTQGLYYEKGFFYEGTGLYGRSSLRVVEAHSGALKKKIDLPKEWFGEGVTVMGDKIIQLTWRSGVGLVYDKNTLHPLQRFRYNHEGWGITHDGKRLIVSDGTDTIRFWHPIEFRELGRISVKDGGKPLYGLNELEYIDGHIFANVWPTPRIVRIDSETGRVTGEFQVQSLLATLGKREVDVANGIAYDASTKRIFITGKFWPRVFVILIKDSE